MLDCFAEHMVKKVPTSQEKTKKILICFLSAILVVATAAIAVITKFMIILIVTCAIIYGTYYLLSGMNIEYEYIFTNGEIDIDKIIAKRKRVHLVTIKTEQFEKFDKWDDSIPDRENATLILCSDNTNKNVYYADLTADEIGKARLIFNPSEEIISCIEKYLPPALRHKNGNIES
ncbi:MAG: hypothetical protein IJZ64_02715 [Ruminococcus sp.]|nr:hypothetical protein [Ruminococcus sp.]